MTVTSPIPLSALGLPLDPWRYPGLTIVYDHGNHTIDVSATPTNSAQPS